MLKITLVQSSYNAFIERFTIGCQKKDYNKKLKQVFAGKG